MPSTELIAQTAGAVGAALIAVAFMSQRLLKGWRETSAEGSILSLMHNELTRMSAQNVILSTELNKLQIDLVTLNKQLFTLSTENQNLHRQIAALTSEVTRLQSIMQSNGDGNGTSKA